QRLRPAVIGLSIDAILVVPLRTLCDPPLRFEQQHRPGPKDHRSSRTYARASRLQALVQARATQLALRHARIKSFPLESRHVIWARDRAVPASDTLLLGPTDDPALGILMECLKWTSRRTCWIQTVHALPLHVREDRSVLFLVELDHVAGEIVQVRRRLVQPVAAGIRRRPVRLRTRRYARLA